jgi:hypothetical protein
LTSIPIVNVRGRPGENTGVLDEIDALSAWRSSVALLRLAKTAR